MAVMAGGLSTLYCVPVALVPVSRNPTHGYLCTGYLPIPMCSNGAALEGYLETSSDAK